MACGCTKKNGVRKFAYVDKDGKETEFSTEIEARAAKIRAGGGGEVKPK